MAEDIFARIQRTARGNDYSDFVRRMKALVYRGSDGIKLEDKPKPEIQEPTDAIVKIQYTTICGTDLHILHGHVPTCKPGITLGHEGVGTIDSVGSAVKAFATGDEVLIACISSCSTCKMCKRGLLSHCDKAGWILGHTIDGCQAEYVRIRLADSSLHKVPKDVDKKALVMLSDIGPTGYEVGVLAGKVQPGSSVVVVGVGPVGLSACLTAKLLSPSLLIAIDKDPARLEAAKKVGADITVDSSKEDAEKIVKDLTQGLGCDTVIEAVGVPESFELCQKLVGFGSTLANIGVHGAPAQIALDKLWGYNMTITTGFVNTTSTDTLMRMFQAGTLKLDDLITHEYNLQKEGEHAYATFGSAAQHKALKMIINTEAS